MIIITPCSRPQNLLKILDTINFDKINNWIIVYQKEVPWTPLPIQNKKIIETEAAASRWGHNQHNAGLDIAEDKNDFVYRLDDDNVMHKDIWEENFILDETNQASLIYTFDTIRRDSKIYCYGKVPVYRRIDTANFCVHTKLIGKYRWWLCHSADACFIQEMLLRNKRKFTYIEKTLGYYNYLR